MFRTEVSRAGAARTLRRPTIIGAGAAVLGVGAVLAVALPTIATPPPAVGHGLADPTGDASGRPVGAR